jgi:hypothetical protein
MSKRKKVNNPVWPKDIFCTIWPDGYESNPLYYGPEGNYNGFYTNQQPVFVVCPKCATHLFSSSRTKYSNPTAHLATCLGGINHLHNLVREAREEDGADNGVISRQVKLREALCMANPQDEALYTWMRLVCLHNTAITKINDQDFCNILSCENLLYNTLVETMIELSIVVEEKIAAVMKVKRGTILHDGWSKFARHYVCLLALYLVPTGKKDACGEDVMEAVITMLTCTTLPHDKEDDYRKFPLPFALLISLFKCLSNDCA